MALLKSYTCRSCGGVLNFDEDQEIFACPFCGEEFNYTDFHREELLSQAVRCLKDLRFDAAKEKYNTLLSNNPQDFEALRGMVLVNGKINSQADLKSAEDLRDCDFAAAIKASEDAGQAVTGTSESLYFERLTALLRLGEEYRDKTADALDKSRSRLGCRRSHGGWRPCTYYTAYVSIRQHIILCFYIPNAMLCIRPCFLSFLCRPTHGSADAERSGRHRHRSW